MYTLTILFVALTWIHLSQCCVTSLLKLVDRDIDESSNEKYPWLVVIRDKADDSYFRLSYGSLIHPKAVLTSAVGIKGYTSDNLIVETDCREDFQEIQTLINCTTRNVSRIIYPNDFDKETVLDNSYVILILKDPFSINSRINVINVAPNANVIYDNNCYFTRWMREGSTIHNTTGLVTASYKTSFFNGSLNIDSFDKDQLQADRDWVISKPFHSMIITNDSISDHSIIPLSFLGSPLVCSLKEDSTKYAQVGIATFQLEIHATKNYRKPIKIKQYGSLVNVIVSQDEIMRKLIKNI